MKIPKTLKIGAHTISIVFKELENANGHSDFAKNEIVIDSTLPQSQKESTLLHEVMHYLNSTLDDSALGHALLDSLAEQIYQVLKDNHLLK